MASSGIRPSKTSPDYLTSNATSHNWVFSAIAELIDNAYDPDVKADQIHLNVEQINGYKCLTFTDDGNGMDENKLYKMLSFGYSEKEEISGHKPIGRYGNGFKSGSMRLGKDALVLTRQDKTMSLGMLSRTYLENIRADTVLIPIVTFCTSTRRQILYNNLPSGDLAAILTHSIFRNGLPELLDHLSKVAADIKGAKRGTKIIMYNLHSHSEATGELELLFDEENKDICLRVMENEPEYKRSLRKYCSILYLKPRMKIVILGKKVQTRLIKKDLCKIGTDTYRPRLCDAGATGGITITFGFNPKNTNNEAYYRTEYGIMIYHKNRLIVAYEKVGYQKQPNELGVGVVGVLEVNYLTPIHNKQSFSTDHKYVTLVTSLGTKLNEYWDAKMNVKAEGENSAQVQADENIVPDSNWVQCDDCNKWRRLPDGVPSPTEDKPWYCTYHTDPRFNNCCFPEETLEQGEIDVPIRTSYVKQKKKRSLVTRRSNDAEAVTFFEEQAKKATEKAEKLRTKQKESRVRRQKNWSVVQSNIDNLDRQVRAMMTDESLNPVALKELLNAYTPSTVALGNRGSVAAATTSTSVAPKSAAVAMETQEDDPSCEPRVQCAVCSRWRYVPMAYFKPADWTCALHPNLEIKKQCTSAGIITVSYNPQVVSPSLEKRAKIEEVDLTKSLSSEDDDDDDRLSVEEEALGKIKNDMLDVNMKVNALCKALVKVKMETNTVALQTEFIKTEQIQVSTQTHQLDIIHVDDHRHEPLSAAPAAPPAVEMVDVELEEELRELRQLSFEILRIALPELPDVEPENVLNVLRQVVEVNKKVPEQL